VHLSANPTALVFVVDSYYGAKSLDQVAFETALVDCSIDILDSASTLSHILVEITLINRTIFIGGSPLPGEQPVAPHSHIFPFWRYSLIGTFPMRLIHLPLPFIAISLPRNQSPAAIAIEIDHLPLIIEALIVQQYEFGGAAGFGNAADAYHIW
jgi:hypothetical protein